MISSEEIASLGRRTFINIMGTGGKLNDPATVMAVMSVAMAYGIIYGQETSRRASDDELREVLAKNDEYILSIYHTLQQSMDSFKEKETN